MSRFRLDRRSFLASGAGLVLGGLGSLRRAAGQAPWMSTSRGRRDLGLMDTSQSPCLKTRSIGLGEVSWTRGFWADRFTVCRESMVPSMWELMSGTEPTQFLQNFKIAAGLAEGRHRGPKWNDGDFYKWIEAASALLAREWDESLDRRLDEVIGIVAKAQREDGYLHTPVQIRARSGDTSAEPFLDSLDFEAYNLGHLMTAACVHHRATGKSNLLAVAVKAGDYLVSVSKVRTRELARNAVCPAHYMGIVELYRTTRDPRYLELARALIDARDLVEGGTDDNQDRIPFRRQTKAAGHAARANYLYAGAADVLVETGDASLLTPLLAVWEDVATHKLAITGGCGALFDGASPEGVKDQKSISRVHQSYGRDYQLPQSLAHNETCAAIGNLLWNQRMLQVTGEARFADVMETTLLNAAMAGVSLEGTRYFYTNTLRQLDSLPADLRWNRHREPFISCFCCPPNLVRTIAESAGFAYGRSKDQFWVHLYGGNNLDTTLEVGRLRLTQTTDYPWDGRVSLTIAEAPAQAVSILLRIPGWAAEASVRVNGVEQPRPLAGSYAEVRQTWKPGDLVELALPMPTRLMEANPLVEEARNQVAIQRGPIVYCVESSDLPEGVRVQDVVIPRAVNFKPRYDAKLLGGVTVLEGHAEAWREPDWSGKLYRELPTAPQRPFDLRLVPYFAWGNRGHSEMSVWMPLGRS
ncbi:glycoside hydrolase family 127 protein [Paludisphaera rhizosphaerae]|uniref:glycoside hydrolase family 127 protein n=1 Tax=Paludisphaera rhizosphaerae TaxID=2711216 RepID=UPI00197F975C|nr:glycoside hydrolase family 127 protein [Paludisphaera rhizosphaerae]